MVQLSAYEIAMLRALDETGGSVTADVSEHAFGSTRRERSANAHHSLKSMMRLGLVRTLDDQKPVCWCRTPSGTKVVAPTPPSPEPPPGGGERG
jgi:hypothetical protein